MKRYLILFISLVLVPFEIDARPIISGEGILSPSNVSPSNASQWTTDNSGISYNGGQVYIAHGASVHEDGLVIELTGEDSNKGLAVYTDNFDNAIYADGVADYYATIKAEAEGTGGIGGHFIGPADGYAFIAQGKVGLGVNFPVNQLEVAGTTVIATLNVSTAITLPAATTPAHDAVCTAGTLWWDAGYIYVCTVSGTVKRATLATY